MQREKVLQSVYISKHTTDLNGTGNLTGDLNGAGNLTGSSKTNNERCKQ